VNLPEKIWRTLVLSINSSIKDAIIKLNDTGLQIILVLDRNDILLGTITDGDIRRGILRGERLEDSIGNIMRIKPVVAQHEMRHERLVQLMHANRLRHLPIVKSNMKVVGLHFFDEITSITHRSNLIIIMAGGIGKRLRPHTEACPKPLLKVAGKPILEHIIERAKSEGFSRFIISIEYLGHMIEEYFANGERLGVHIDYLRETVPLGTAGALGLLSSCPELPFVVTNGDIMSRISYADLLDFHAQNDSMATMAVRMFEWQNPFGVVKTKGVDIIGFEEKPIFRSHINAGIYVLSPEALNVLQVKSHCDMPMLFERLKAEGNRTIAFPMYEQWLDIGRLDDLEKANSENSDLV